MNLIHKNGIFGSIQTGWHHDDKNYYLEFDEESFRLVCKYIDKTINDIDISNAYSIKKVLDYIEEGIWVEWIL